MSNIENKLIVILMGTFNGSQYLSEQLDSIEKQTHENWRLIVSDDGSDDSTVEILNAFKDRWATGKLELIQGPKKGFCYNFLSLACDTQIKGDYYAFCDQDDFWLPNKLEVALQIITRGENSNQAFLYCGRTIYVDNRLKRISQSTEYKMPKVFNNALVQSIAGGNTMLFNQATKHLLEVIGLKSVASHDWWLYQLVTGTDGKIFYDTNPYVLYRQHAGALVGRNNTFISKLERLIAVAMGKFRKLNNQNIDALRSIQIYLSLEAQQSLEKFIQIRNSSFFYKIKILSSCDLFRQTIWQTRMMKVAILFKLA